MNSDIEMNMVYCLKTELANDPDYVKDAQALTLDTTRPSVGLSGKNGLFGSKQWWENIQNGTIPRVCKTGVILRAYRVGQDKARFNNTVDIVLEDGTVESRGIFVHQASDADFFRRGHRVTIIYILDELKAQPASDGGINYLDITLEMAVSAKPVVKGMRRLFGFFGKCMIR